MIYTNCEEGYNFSESRAWTCAAIQQADELRAPQEEVPRSAKKFILEKEVIEVTDEQRGLGKVILLLAFFIGVIVLIGKVMPGKRDEHWSPYEAAVIERYEEAEDDYQESKYR